MRKPIWQAGTPDALLVVPSDRSRDGYVVHLGLERPDGTRPAALATLGVPEVCGLIATLWRWLPDGARHRIGDLGSAPVVLGEGPDEHVANAIQALQPDGLALLPLDADREQSRIQARDRVGRALALLHFPTVRDGGPWVLPLAVAYLLLLLEPTNAAEHLAVLGLTTEPLDSVEAARRQLALALAAFRAVHP